MYFIACILFVFYYVYFMCVFLFCVFYFRRFINFSDKKEKKICGYPEFGIFAGKKLKITVNPEIERPSEIVRPSGVWLKNSTPGRCISGFTLFGIF
jgi:hypothetical protein